MADTEAGRYWSIDLGCSGLRYEMLRGSTLNAGGAAFHINASIIGALRRTKPAAIVVAGGWAIPTNLILSIVRPKDTPTWFWSESHLASRRHAGRVVDRLRGVALRQYDGFLVPGRLASDYIQSYVPSADCVRLPNIVDEGAFCSRVEGLRAQRDRIRERLGISCDTRVLLSTIRLIPQKGVVDAIIALAALPMDIADQVVWLIAGDGPMKPELEERCRQHPNLRVRFVGHRDSDRLLELFAIADGFLLPSRSDPNPLSVIEALWASLPLILTDRVGNHPETLSTRNGWLARAGSPESLSECLQAFATAPAENLERFAKVSNSVARGHFASESVCAAAAAHLDRLC